MTGTSGDDSINGTAGDDSLFGDEGEDTIRGGAGADTIDGWTGDDSLDGGAGDDSILGYDGNDTISGGDGRDTVNGGTGDDSISGDAGDDKLSGGSGGDTITGGAGDDSIEGNDGGSGADGNDSIDGGDGRDTISGDVGDDTLRGGNGDDAIEGSEGADSIDGGAGNDYLAGSDVNGLNSSAASGDTDPPTKNEDNASDTISGGDGDDSIFGNGGDDSLDGGSGRDWMRGGTGDDSMTGGSESDTVIGEEGRDTLFGGDGDDTISGHEGDDALHGDTGKDSLYGGSGEDYFDGGAGDDQNYMARSAGGGSDDPGEGDRDVIRFEPGTGNDAAYDFEGENDFIFIGNTPQEDIVYTQIAPSTWVLNIAGNTSDSLTLNFVPGTEPDSAGELNNQVITSSEYTPPQNGNAAQWNVSCFTPHARMLTPDGPRAIGTLGIGDLVQTADHGAQRIEHIISSRFSAALLRRTSALRPVVIEAGAFGAGLPHARMHVSRQHSFAAQNSNALVRAVHLADPLRLARVQKNRPNPITYVHLILANHELVQVEGVWTETYFSKAVPNDPVTYARNTALPIHSTRCRPLLTRADLRRTPVRASEIGRRGIHIYDTRLQPTQATANQFTIRNEQAWATY